MNDKTLKMASGETLKHGEGDGPTGSSLTILQPQCQEPFRMLETQVAGHTFEMNAKTLGLLQDPTTGCVLKPLGKPECGLRELAFYESLQNTEDPVLAQAITLVPRFYNKLKLVVNQSEHTFLKMEDLTYGMVKPCIIDIKIGKRTWDPVASPQKRAVEEEKYARCKKVLGLCLPGFQLYPVNSGKLVRHGKEYGKQLDADGFRATIAYFLNAQPMLCVPMINELLEQLNAIRSWFNVQRLLHFYASSLLIAYDFESLLAHLSAAAQNGPLINGSIHGAAEENSIKTGTKQLRPPGFLPDPKNWIKVRMIDFAHVFPAENGSPDTNYLFGLENLISIIENLLMQ